VTPTTLTKLNAATSADFVAALGGIFEHSPWIAEAAAARRPFVNLTALLAAMTGAVRGVPRDKQLALIATHPELGVKLADLTAHSTAEQSSAGLDRLSQAEYERFRLLSQSYREIFGFPFIVCVRRHTKDSILREGERRLANKPDDERAIALDEICRIAALRLDATVEAPERLAVHGRLSTHVLDTYHGRPAAGVAVTLIEICALAEPRTIARAVTDANGRTAEPLIAGRPLPMGRYELRFEVGAYFAAQGVALSEPVFLDVVPIRFGVADPEANYHVPLVVTPWAYSTYRGS
jgi:2-oxo-4-hydroxy-4-carboxy-5-ureidoimidazoline decarboxylase